MTQLSGHRASKVVKHKGLTALTLTLTVATMSVLLLPESSPVRAAVTLACVTTLPGAALMRAVGVQRLRQHGFIIVIASLCLIALISQGLLWLGLWEPELSAVVLVAVSAAVLVAPRTSSRSSARESNAGLAGERERPDSSKLGEARQPSRLPVLRRFGWGRSWVLLLLAVVLWAASLPAADLQRIGGYGLLPALPWSWYAATALTIGVGVVTALRRPDRVWLLGAVTVVLVLILQGTPALLYGIPRYNWSYKHIGAVDAINMLQGTPRALDIYFNWPGFFSTVAWLSRVSGISVTTMATWAPVANQIGFAAATLFVARGLTRDVRVVWLTAYVALLTNWVGQDYFAPQGFAVVVGIAIVGVLLRTWHGHGRTTVQIVRWLARRLRGRHTGPYASRWGDDVCSPLPLTNVGALVLIWVLWLALVTSHQLTPVVVLLSLIVVGLSRGILRPVLLSAMVVVEIAWVALALPYLNSHGFSLLDFDPFRSSRPSIIDMDAAMPGMETRFLAVLGLYFGMFVIALWAGLRRLRAGQSMTPMLLALVTPLVLVAQSYGGEGRLRVYLFALPYLAFLLADLLANGFGNRFGTAGRRSALVRGKASVAFALAAVLALTAASVPCYYGQEKMNRVRHADVQAADWYYHNATPASLLAYLAPNVPTRVSGRYVQYQMAAADTEPNVLSAEAFRRTHSPESILQFLGELPGPVYFIFTPSQGSYLELFGLMTPREISTLVEELDSQVRLQLVYRRDGSSIWALQGRHQTDDVIAGIPA